jgi:hypothetical protein
MPELIELGRTGLLVEDFVGGYHQIEECFEMDRNYIAQRARLLFNYRAMTAQYLDAYRHVTEIFDGRAAVSAGRVGDDGTRLLLTLR